ncbi:MAG TPA: diacylglycerol kinase family protein [Devosiaceae bacterium]|jgi:diacylglycerol kinase family enzyme|nr:diacylglycerol kinase family protein [Devosiaceae bacterium]
MHFIGVLNRDGGSFREMDLAAFAADAERVFAENGHTIECRLVSGENLRTELEDAAGDARADGLVVGGGDGSVSAAAEVAFRRDVLLAVLPAGTMNLFARSLKVPLELQDALRALAKGSPGRADIATANGKPFVHQYSVGVHPRLVRVRESFHYHGRLGKIAASIRAIALAVTRPPRFDVEIELPDRILRQNASNISVSNNLLGPGHIPHADQLDRGVLGVYVVKPMGTMAMARFCVSVLIGSWKGSPLVTEQQVKRVRLRFPHRKSSAQAIIDGELVPLETTIDIATHPGGLRVLMPAVEMSGYVAA